MSVAGRLRRNRKMTRTTSATARTSSNWTSSTEARIVVVRSLSTETSIDGGSESRSRGSMRLHVLDDLDDIGARLALNVRG